MSLILDALKRSQQDRLETGGVPGLATSHHAPGPVDAGRWRWLPWLGLFAALGAVAWLLLERMSPATGVNYAEPRYPGQPPASAGPVVPMASGAAEVAVEPEPLPVDAPEPLPVEAGPALTAGAVSTGAESTAAESTAAESTGAESTAAESTAAESTAAESTAAESTAAESTGESGSSSARVAALYARQPDPVGDAPAPGPSTGTAPAEPQASIDVERALEAAREDIARAGLSEHSAPFISELSQSDKDAIPSLIYSRHDYNGSGRSAVVLNGAVLPAGQMTRGVQVVEILPQSVVLDYRGLQFRLRALNSWVNL